MNICISNIRECNPMIGGVERVSSILAHEWEQMGISVIFLSQSQTQSEVNYSPIVKQYYLPNSDVVFSPANTEYAIEVLRENKIDVILNQSSNHDEFSHFLTYLKEILNLKLVSSYHYAPLCNITAQQNNFFILSKMGFRPSQIILHCISSILFFLFKKNRMHCQEKHYYSQLYHNSDAIVVLSKHYLDLFAKLISLDSPPKLFAISNPTIITDINQITIAPKKKQILYVGRLEYGLKRVDRLIRIWGQLHKTYLEWELIIVGDGDYKHNFEKMVSSRKIQRVRFEGFKEPEDYMSQGSIICMTSSAEGFGMVLVEAQQHGCVPIAYDSFGALSDIIEDGVNGFRVKPFSQKEYVKRLRQLMDDEDLRQKMAANGLESVKKFDSKKITVCWIELFNEICR